MCQKEVYKIQNHQATLIDFISFLFETLNPHSWENSINKDQFFSPMTSELIYHIFLRKIFLPENVFTYTFCCYLLSEQLTTTQHVVGVIVTHVLMIMRAFSNTTFFTDLLRHRDVR